MRGPDEAAVRAILGPELIAFWEGLDADERWAAAGRSSVVVYRQPASRTARDRELPPDQIADFFARAEEIAARCSVK